MIQLCTSEHEHIVSILRHGWLDTTRCFVDMELCDINLEDYIEGRFVVGVLVHQPEFISHGTESYLRLMNTWTIMIHISCGLEFIHEKGFSHRDLKPANGNAGDLPI